MSQLYNLDGLSLVKVMTEDRAFLLQLYASSRAADMSIFGLSEIEKNAYIEKQFNAQQHYFQKQFAKGKFLIIKKGVAKIGRLYLDKLAKEIRIIDLMLMPSYRSFGIEKMLIEAIIEDARELSVDIAIELQDDASLLSLYKSLGFQAHGVQGKFQHLRWSDNKVSSL